jgi:hypothetical protein
MEGTRAAGSPAGISDGAPSDNHNCLLVEDAIACWATLELSCCCATPASNPVLLVRPFLCMLQSIPGGVVVRYITGKGLHSMGGAARIKPEVCLHGHARVVRACCADVPMCRHLPEAALCPAVWVGQIAQSWGMPMISLLP